MTLINHAGKIYINTGQSIDLRTPSRRPAFSARPAVMIETVTPMVLKPRDYLHIGLRKTVLSKKASRDFLANIWDRMPNFKKFNPEKILAVEPGKMLRGPTPSTKKFDELAKRKVDAIINFQILPPKRIEKMKQAAEARGMEFINIPTNASKGATKDALERVDNVVRRLEEEGKTGYFCCRHGSDRTGFYSARYKVNKGLATSEEAVEEMREIGYREYLFPVLKGQVPAERRV